MSGIPNKETWRASRNVTSSNSFGLVAQENAVALTVTVSVSESKEDGKQRGYFEWFGDDWYASGGLWFKDNTLVDFDGVYSLSELVLCKLHEWGFDVVEIAGHCEVCLE